tara:strand:- start:76 stop:813 length:738 start_codon:yes stop_codon:yes gene_type:complete
MAIIPSGQKFHTVSSNVDTENKGSAQANSGREAFTMQDITDSVGGGEVNVQADWDELNNSEDSFIKNKPIVMYTVETVADLPSGGLVDNNLVWVNAENAFYHSTVILADYITTFTDTISWSEKGGLVAAYTSSFIKVSQSGAGEPNLTFISNDAGLVLGTDTRMGTGQYYFTFTGTPPDEDNVMIVLPGGLRNGEYSFITLVSEYRNSGQLFINTYGVNGSGALIPTDIGFGGSNSFTVEIKVFS